MSHVTRTFSEGSNLWHDPAKEGFEHVAVLEDESLWYEFDITLLLRDLHNGRLYLVQDNGCSCPSPFENYRGMGDLIPVGSLNEVGAFVRRLNNQRERYTANQVWGFIRAAQVALR